MKDLYWHFLNKVQNIWQNAPPSQFQNYKKSNLTLWKGLALVMLYLGMHNVIKYLLSTGNHICAIIGKKN